MATLLIIGEFSGIGHQLSNKRDDGGNDGIAPFNETEVSSV